VTAALQQLVAQAQALTEPSVTWVMIGGRPCPLGWSEASGWRHCSQPVFESACGRYADHGERGGPADTFCRAECPNGYQPPPSPDITPSLAEPCARPAPGEA